MAQHELHFLGFTLLFVALVSIIVLLVPYLPQKSDEMIPASSINERNRRTTEKKYKVEHVEYISSQSFEKVIANFEGLVGNVENGSLKQLVMTAKTQAEFETGVHALEGESGFLQFLLINHGSYLPLFGIVGKKVRMYTVGNPLLAVTMIKHDLAAALNVPVRLVIYENSADNTVRLAYDLPSSLMSQLRNNDVTKAAKILDARLEDLCERATGVSPR